MTKTKTKTKKRPFRFRGGPGAVLQVVMTKAEAGLIRDAARHEKLTASAWSRAALAKLALDRLAEIAALQ